jgi:hypothetical protein
MNRACAGDWDLPKGISESTQGFSQAQCQAAPKQINARRETSNLFDDRQKTGNLVSSMHFRVNGDFFEDEVNQNTIPVFGRKLEKGEIAKNETNDEPWL